MKYLILTLLFLYGPVLFFLGQYRGRKIEAELIANALRVHSRINREVAKAYMTIKTDVRLAEAKALARFKRFL